MTDIAQRAIQLAEELAAASLAQRTPEETRHARRLARMMNDPRGKAFTLAMVDRVFRSQRAAAQGKRLRDILAEFGNPKFLSPGERALLHMAAAASRLWPGAVMGAVERVLRRLSAQVILPGEREPLDRYLRTRQAQGIRVNLNYLGEAVLGEEESEHHLQAVLDHLANPLVDYVSVKISAIFSQINLLDRQGTLGVIKERLRRLYRAAGAGSHEAKFVNLDMEEYRDLDLTLSAFEEVLDEEEFLGHSAGIALQAYLPDSWIAQQRLVGWAKRRAEAGGTPIKMRLVKGANLAMEAVEAGLHGWNAAPYSSKAKTDANYRRMLEFACRPENAAAVRLGVASHNLFDIALALVLREEMDVERFVEMEMLEGMANHQARAVRQRAGGLLVYAPCVRREDFFSAMAYLVRRLDENTAAENFLHDMFALSPGSPAWQRQRERFERGWEQRDEVQSASNRGVPSQLDPALRSTSEPAWPNNERENALPPLLDFGELSRGVLRERVKVRVRSDVAVLAGPLDDPGSPHPNPPPKYASTELAEVQERGQESTRAPVGHVEASPFFNAADTDWTQARHRQALAEAMARYRPPNLPELPALDRVLDSARAAQPAWEELGFEGRAHTLLRCADVMERHRFDTIVSMMHGAKKTAVEGDGEVSEGVDYARYYAAFHLTTGGAQGIAACGLADQAPRPGLAPITKAPVSQPPPSPGLRRAQSRRTPGEGRGEGSEQSARPAEPHSDRLTPHPNPLPEYASMELAEVRAREKIANAVALSARPLGLVVVTPPWNFPYAIPAGGVLAALASGNSVVLKPAPESVTVAWTLVNQLWQGGVPRDVVQFYPVPDGEGGQALITDPRVDAVILTGAYETARRFLDWRPTLRLFAETSGKNALIITAQADRDLAVRDLVRSAFGHAGQKCSAASLAILEAEVYDDANFRRVLRDAAASLRVGPATDLAAVIPPLIRPPGEALHRALTTLDPGEEWLLQPRVDANDPCLWTPGIKLGVRRGSFFHQTECFGPVLGVMRAENVAHAIALQNDVPFGLTGGIHSLNQAEIDQWVSEVQVGNAYVNRAITGAIVRRQPFGGWKRSSIGPGFKAGGPNYTSMFLRIENAARAAALSPSPGTPGEGRGGGERRPPPNSPHPKPPPECGSTELAEVQGRESDSRDVQRTPGECSLHAPREEPHAEHEGYTRVPPMSHPDEQCIAHASESYIIWWRDYFSLAHDPSALRSESNILRYRPCRGVILRLNEPDEQSLALARLAAQITGVSLHISLGTDESEAALAARLPALSRDAEFLRTILPPSPELLRAAYAAGLNWIDAPLLSCGRYELPRWLREQSVSITRHRYGLLSERRV